MTTVRTLVAVAVLMAAGMVAAGATAGRVLRERDAAVREGVLSRVAHGLENDLRRNGPEQAGKILRDAVNETREVSAIEIHNGKRVLFNAGQPRGQAVELPIAPGPEWRALAEGGAAQHRGSPPFRIRLWPGEGLGDSSLLAATATWGSLAAALALLGLSLVAARGAGARERAAAIEAERGRLELVALAGAGLAHRIRNPLATMKATAQILESTLDGADRERAARIAGAASRTETLLDELLRFARPVDPQPEPLDLRDIATAFSEEANVVAAAEPLRVVADREHLIGAVEELLANARAFDNGTPEIAAIRQGREAAIEVRDRGPGLQITPSKAFDPYVTTRADGSGLGLATIAALMRANGGSVTLSNREGGGCVATIRLPEARA